MLNNVETLANIAPILLNGAEWYRNIGTTEQPWHKAFYGLWKCSPQGRI